MRINWNYIRFSGLLLVTVLLYAFASQRNSARLVDKVAIKFDDESTPFVTRETVDKLLIQSKGKVTGMPKEKLALNEMEKRVTSHPTIKSADVYVTMAGTVGVAIEQRKPIARVYGATSFYLDQDGEEMPLSKNFSARVPIVNGIEKKDIPTVTSLILYIKNDAFLNKHIIGVRKQKGNQYTLIPRKLDYEILLGDVASLEHKLTNYKAFYQKAQKDKTLDMYQLINLKYTNQVVCKKR
ncbi:cell division protein FtsQ/DivIB [Dokdonia ponticola]|uniref:Cell division protein FtsQ/DivIB n=1 Tax=Dokdonia ponticola TaxID=2041041 RepID=A0ABV9HU89_9FLAO